MEISHITQAEQLELFVLLERRKESLQKAAADSGADLSGIQHKPLADSLKLVNGLLHDLMRPGSVYTPAGEKTVYDDLKGLHSYDSASKTVTVECYETGETIARYSADERIIS